MSDKPRTLLGFIIRAEKQSDHWRVLLHNFKTGEQTEFSSLEACSSAIVAFSRQEDHDLHPGRKPG